MHFRFVSCLLIIQLAVIVAGNNIDFEEESCAPGQFMCSNGDVCIPSSYLCDGAKDCEDGTDELDCRILISKASNATKTPSVSEAPGCTSWWIMVGINGIVLLVLMVLISGAYYVKRYRETTLFRDIVPAVGEELWI